MREVRRCPIDPAVQAARCVAFRGSVSAAIEAHRVYPASAEGQVVLANHTDLAYHTKIGHALKEIARAAA